MQIRTLALLAACAAAALPVRAADPAAAASDKDSKVPAHQKHPVDPNAPKPMGKMVALKTEKGASKAYAAHPKGPIKGGILVIHEWWGLNDHIKHQADVLAAEGYLALAIDLYKGVVATKPEEAQKAMGALNQPWGDAVEEAGLEWLKKESGGKKLATIGWCMGGGQSLNASLHDPKDVAATVIFYGMPVMDVEKLKTLKGPVFGVWANKDGWITPDKVATFAAACKAAGVPYTGNAYDADHAFANPTGGKHNPEAAKDAWAKTLVFLADNLK